MAKVKSDQADFSKIITKFRGLGSSDTYLDDGADTMLNFRLTAEGTLQKREGIRNLTYLPGMVRGIWQGTIGGYPYTFIVTGNTVWQIDTDGWYQTNIHTLSSNSGPVDFCEMNGCLYLLDGSTITVFDSNSYAFMEATPYAPLIGENWHPTSMGQSKELPNLLTPRMRVHYKNTSGATTFYLPYYAKSVDCVLVNSSQTSDYVFTANTNHVKIPSAASATEIVIAFTAPFNEYQRRSMLAAQRAFVFSDAGTQRMILYRTNEPYKLYLSSEVTDAMKNYCDLFYYGTTPIYFTSPGIFFVGDSQDPVTSICPYYSSALIFTKNTTRLLRTEDGIPDTDVVLPHVGCTPVDGALVCDGTIVTVSKSSVYRLTSRRSTPEDITAERVSDRVMNRMRNSITENTIVFWNPRYLELWIATPQEESGLIWVWNARENEWYNFDDLPATHFFNTSQGDVWCINGNVIYEFYDYYYHDDGNSYNATYTTKYLDLGDPDAVHRPLRWAITARTTGSTTVMITTPRGNTQSTITKKIAFTYPEYYEGRIYPNRHRYIRFTFNCTGSGNVALYRIALCSKK